MSLRVQQRREGLRNEISDSKKEKNTNEYTLWQKIARKYREKNQRSSFLLFNILCALVLLFPFPNLQRQLIKRSRAGFFKQRQPKLNNVPMVCQKD